MFATGIGRIAEAKAAAWFGDAALDHLKLSSSALTIPVPVAGAPISMYRGHVVPRLAGGMGFASLADLISEAQTNGKRQDFRYYQVGSANSLSGLSAWLAKISGNIPLSSETPAAPPGGTVVSSADANVLKIRNAAAGDTLHLAAFDGVTTAPLGATLLLFDCLWATRVDVATLPQAVTGAPNRYTGTNAAGNFFSARVFTALAATAHNLTVTYVDQAGAAAEAGTAQAVRVSAAQNTTPFTAPQWTYDLNSPDTGLRNVTNLAISAATTGTVDYFIGHPLALLPMAGPNQAFALDGILSAFNLVKIEDNAAPLIEHMFPTAAGSQTHAGSIMFVSG